MARAADTKGRRPLAAWEACPGEHGAFVESCSSCMPFWKVIPFCPSPVCGQRLKVNRKRTIGTCSRHGRFRIDINTVLKLEES